jgi:murein L,D-transpeptidase YafK
VSRTLVPTLVPPQEVELKGGRLAIVFLQCVLFADKVVVSKKDHTLELFDHGKLLKKYNVALGGEPTGPKERQGDHKTPEGVYVLDRRNENSHFYRSLHTSYPNAVDRARAHKAGVEPGGDIMIHGLPDGFGWIGTAHRMRDGTDGCIAVTNQEMEEIWRTVPDGTPIEIRP